jgi:hypothetical protein
VKRSGGGWEEEAPFREMRQPSAMSADERDSGAAQLLGNGGKIEPYTRAFRSSESEFADFSEVRVRKFRTLKTLRTRTQRVCLFTHL